MLITTKLWTRGIVVVGLVAVLSGYGIAAEQNSCQMGGQSSMMSQQSGQQALSPRTDLTIRRSSQLIGKPLKNEQGESLGTIYDLVLTPDLSHVSYLAITRGGVFDIGNNLYAIPWSALRIGASGAYVAPIPENELSQWQCFSPSAWPSSVSRIWIGGTQAGAGMTPTAQENRSVQDRRVSRVQGSLVNNSEGANTGKVQSLVFAMNDGRVLYTIVSFGGVFGMGGKYAAVPQGAIDLQPAQRMAKLTVGTDVLQANSFAAGQFPDLGSASYARNVDRAYGTKTSPEWVALGYIPAAEPPATSAMSETQTSGMRMPRAMSKMSATGRIEAFRINPRATFDPAAVETIDGVVTVVGKSAPTESGEVFLVLQVRANSGKLYTVNAGSLKYVSKQDFYAVRGDHITLTGSPARGDRSLFLATRISADGQNLLLRNSDGQPLWEHSSEGVSSGQMSEAPTP